MFYNKHSIVVYTPTTSIGVYIENVLSHMNPELHFWSHVLKTLEDFDTPPTLIRSFYRKQDTLFSIRTTVLSVPNSELSSHLPCSLSAYFVYALAKLFIWDTATWWLSERITNGVMLNILFGWSCIPFIYILPGSQLPGKWKQFRKLLESYLSTYFILQYSQMVTLPVSIWFWIIKSHGVCYGNIYRVSIYTYVSYVYILYGYVP